MLNLLLFPLDLIYLTVDAIRISMDIIMYAPLRGGGDQPCIHCKNRDCGYRPRRLPAGLRKYRNRWLGCWLQPCIKRKKNSKEGPRRFCHQDGAFVTYSKWIHLLTLFCLAAWFELIYWVIKLIY